jgi:hypothetical protein
MAQFRSIPIGMLLVGLLAASSMSLAQQQGSETDHSAHHGPTDQPTAGQSPGSDQTSDPSGEQSAGMMMGDCPMMGQGRQGMMGQGMMRQGMMGQGMMGRGMMRDGSCPDRGRLFGSRVTPMMNLSIEDVRAYLTVQLERLNNKRLKVGEIKADDGTITADVVTVDNSLVQRLKVDRRTGAIEYQD